MKFSTQNSGNGRKDAALQKQARLSLSRLDGSWPQIRCVFHRGFQAVLAAFVFTVVLIGERAFSSPETLPQNAIRLEAATVKAQSEPSISTELYGETYPAPLQEGLASFARLRLAPRDAKKIHAFAELNHERFYLTDGSVNRLGIEAGAAWKLSSLRLSVSLTQRGLDATPENRSNQLRAGATTGYFRQSQLDLFIDAYAESFYIQPERQQGALVVNGFVKGGYRAYARHHLIFDPFVLELRGSENTQRGVAGPGFLLLNAGPRLSWWLSEPQVSASIFAARSEPLLSSQPSRAGPYWFVFSVGGEF